MRLDIRLKNVELSSSLRTWIERRLRFALSRFGPRIRRVRLGLADMNGPKGGIDVQCSLEAMLERGGTIVAEVSDAEIEAAVSRAAERLARRVDDAVQRTRDLRRRPNPVPPAQSETSTALQER